MLDDVTRKTIEQINSIYGRGSGNVKKAASVTTAAGLTAYDLQAPAKNLYPVLTPIRNKLPRTGGIGTATHWVQVSAIGNGAGYGAMGWVPEGQRAGKMSVTTSPKSASYVTLGTEISLSYEAFNAGRGFEDEKARNVIRGLQQLMLIEETAIIGGNNSLSLGTTTTPTSTTVASTGAVLNTTYSCIAVAMTYEGYRNWITSGAAIATGLVQQNVITGQDGNTYTLNGGYAIPSANKTQAVTTGNALVFSVVPMTGAFAYAWYVGVAGAEKLQSVTTVGTATFASLTTTGQTAASLAATDYSKNATAFDGFLTTAASGTGAYYNSLANGSKLTASGHGSITEIDTMLQSMWDNYQVSPTEIYVNSQQQKDITAGALSGGSNAPLIRVVSDNANNSSLQANQVVASYLNPFVAGQPQVIPVMIHPTLPAGTILGWSDDLPLQYQDSNVPNVAEIKARQDYYEIDWPQVTREYRSGVYTEEVLTIYAPFALGVINNITPGLT